uniref:VOC domain-containing protein n=1 Tax=Oryza meridionalis TaxID=40149 RepID=A0A0E0EFI6_9ORYZ
MASCRRPTEMGEVCKRVAPSVREEEEEEEKEEEENGNGGGVDPAAESSSAKLYEDVPEMPLMALNHISRLCKSVDASVRFYVKALGFVLIHRPPALDFNGAWLFNYGVGIHLVQRDDARRAADVNPGDLDPMDNHISFQCEDMEMMEKRLNEMGIEYMKRTINEEEGSPIDQLFFKDPDGFMIEICNCENLELVPAGALGRLRLPRDRHNPPLRMDADDEA